MTDTSALDIETVMSASIHEPSTKPDAEREAAIRHHFERYGHQVRGWREGMYARHHSAEEYVHDDVEEAYRAFLHGWQARASLFPAIPVDAIEYALAAMESERNYLANQYSGRTDSMADVWKRRLGICIEAQSALRKLLESAK